MIKTFDELYDILQQNGIRFAIGGSYPMRFIREPRDRDIDIHWKDWPKVLVLGIGQPKMYQTPGYSVETEEGHADLFYHGYPKGFGYTDLEQEGFVHDEKGRQCWTLDQMVRWKKAYDRPKDREDLALVDQWQQRAMD